MACGVLLPVRSMIGGMASALVHNLVPETNDLVYTGNWKQAFLHLNKTHSFRSLHQVCQHFLKSLHVPANLNGDPVSTRRMRKRSSDSLCQKDG